METSKIDTKVEIIDPLLQGTVSVKGYSDNLFADKEVNKTEPIKNETVQKEKTDTQTQIAPKKEQEEPVKKEPSNIGKNYKGDDIDDMFVDIKNNPPKIELGTEQPIDDVPKQDIKITKEHAEAFAGMVTHAVKTFVPPVFVFLANKISGIKEAQIYDYVYLQKKLPEEFYQTYEKDQASLHKTLSISDEELEMIKGSFARFAQYKEIKAVNPQTEFFGSVALVFGNLVMKSIEEGAKSKARWDKVFEKFEITQ